VIGATAWVEFRVDLAGSDLRMTGHPEDVPPVARGIIPHVDQRAYRAYPLVDHVADKVAATYERHGAEQVPSTRYRDVIDLVSIVTGASVSAGEQRLALESEFRRRGLTLPSSFDVPDRSLWEPGYAAEARRSLLTVGADARRGSRDRPSVSRSVARQDSRRIVEPRGSCLDRVAASSSPHCFGYCNGSRNGCYHPP